MSINLVSSIMLFIGLFLHCVLLYLVNCVFKLCSGKNIPLIIIPTFWLVFIFLSGTQFSDYSLQVRFQISTELFKIQEVIFNTV